MGDLRSLPKVDVLSRSSGLSRFPEKVRVAAARLAVDEMRTMVRSAGGPGSQTAERLAVAHAERIVASSLRAVINLSGVILHTGLGRARLGPAVMSDVARVVQSHSLLELDAESGKRGDRQDHVRGLLQDLTGAESAIVVNNAAGAIVLSLAAVAGGGGVALSRGQMVEIGGSFRVPDIIRESGCRIVEVGCTNKTRLSDYEEALQAGADAIMRCHTSNYRIVGFAGQPTLEEIVTLAHAYGVPCVDDMGTGCVVDTRRFGMQKIPTIQDSVQAGVDVVIASGDKLLGGPQAGLILGKAETIDRIARSPLARAVRIDKLCLAALESVLRHYAEGREDELPTIAAMGRTLEHVKSLAGRLAACVRGAVVEEGVTELGSGSAPGTGIPTWRVGLGADEAEDLMRRLRSLGIIGRIESGRVWLDPRTLEEEEADHVCEMLKSL